MMATAGRKITKDEVRSLYYSLTPDGKAHLLNAMKAQLTPGQKRRAEGLLRAAAAVRPRKEAAI